MSEPILGREGEVFPPLKRKVTGLIGKKKKKNSSLSRQLGEEKEGKRRMACKEKATSSRFKEKKGKEPSFQGGGKKDKEGGESPLNLPRKRGKIH